MSDTPEKDRDDPAQRGVPGLLRPILVLADHISWISSACLLALAGVVIVDVVGRSFNAPLSSGSDIGAMLMVGIVFLAISGTQVSKDHVSMDALVSVFPPRLRAIADRLSLLVCLLLGVFLMHGTIKAAIKSFNVGEMALGALRLPLWPAKSIVAFGLGLYTLVLLAQLLGADLRGSKQDSMPPPGTE